MSTITPEEALTEEQLENTVAAIRTYTWDDEPGVRISNEIENRFWETITGEDNLDRDYIPYDGLAEGIAEQIGYVDEDDEERRLPWWLDAFEWRFEMETEGVVHVNSDSDTNTVLDELKNYAPEKTRVHKPKFDGGKKRANIKKLLDGLSELQTAILESSVVDEDRVSVENKNPLPDQVFRAPEPPNNSKKEQDSIATTGDFDEWVKGLLELCPPFHQTTTALLWYNTGLSERAVDSLGIDVASLKDAGIANGSDHLHNDKYRDAFCESIMPFRGIFDRHVGGMREENPMGNGLEAAYIHSWAEDVEDLTKKEIEALRRSASLGRDGIDDDAEARFASCCLTLPLYFARNSGHTSLAFDTHKRITRRLNPLKSPGVDQESRAEEIILTLETSYGLLPSQDQNDE